MTRTEAWNRVAALTGYKNKELEDGVMSIIDDIYIERKARKAVRKYNAKKPRQPLHFTSAYQDVAADYQLKLRGNINIEL